MIVLLLALSLAACGLPTFGKVVYEDASQLVNALWLDETVKGKVAGVYAANVLDTGDHLEVETGKAVLIKMDYSKPVEPGDYFTFRIMGCEQRGSYYYVDAMVLNIEKNSSQGILQDNRNPYLTILETGYKVIEENTYVFGAVIQNNTEDKIVKFPDVFIVLRDENGLVMNTYNSGFMRLYPGEIAGVGSYVYSEDGKLPNSISASVSDLEEYFVIDTAEESPYIPVTAEVIGWEKEYVKLRLTNPNDYEVEPCLTIIFRDSEGNMVACDNYFSETIQPNSELETEEWINYKLQDYEMELHVSNWNY